VSRRSKKAAKLDAIYAKLPAFECKGLCSADCVSGLIMSKAEARRLELAAGSKPQARVDAPCPHLKGSKCSVYKLRPMVCRLFGVVEDMRCPHGCKPVLSSAEGVALVNASIKVGGSLVMPYSEMKEASDGSS